MKKTGIGNYPLEWPTANDYQVRFTSITENIIKHNGVILIINY